MTPDGYKAAVPAVKKWTATSGEAKGAAVRLYAPGEVLAVAEGIETALAVHVANGLPVWAGLSAFGVSHMHLPAIAREVFIFADHDENGTGQQAAEALAARCLDEGREVRVLLPSEAGRDWLDVLTGAEVAL
jgi:putative DNA primase/helicase